MNIKDFLLDNYIWFLVVILLCIVTVIGFLADRKRSKKVKENENKNQNVPNNNGVAMNYQQQPQMNYQPLSQTEQNNMGMMYSNQNMNNLQDNMQVNNTIPQPNNNQNVVMPQAQYESNITTSNNKQQYGSSTNE